MKKVYLFCLITILTISGLSYAQQDPQFSQNMFNRLPVNPAYAGSNDALCGTLLYRNQWIGFEGAPQTGLFSVEGPVPALNGGLGATFMYDKLGKEKNLAGKLAYSYRLNVGAGKLGIGIDAGFMQKELSGTGWITSDGAKDGSDDQAVPTTASGAAFSATSPDLGLGLYYYNPSGLYTGFSADHLTASKMDFKVPSKIVTPTMARHYYILAGYDYEINPTWTLKPSLLIKSDVANTQIDVNALVLWNHQVFGGLSYRYQDAVVVLVGLQTEKGFKCGFSYDITTSDMRSYSKGTAEIMLGFCFQSTSRRSVQQINNVRFQ